VCLVRALFFSALDWAVLRPSSFFPPFSWYRFPLLCVCVCVCVCACVCKRSSRRTRRTLLLLHVHLGSVGARYSHCRVSNIDETIFCRSFQTPRSGLFFYPRYCIR